jgi:hypothetical protein
MKNNNVYFILFFVLLLSCRKEKIALPSYYWGNANAEKNGKDWASEQKNWTLTVYGILESRGARMKKDSFALLIDNFNENNAMRERIGVSGIPIRIGTYKVFNSTEAVNYDRDTLTMASFTLSEQDGDVQSGYYNVLETAQNIISVDVLDTISNEVRGKFNVTFINKYPKSGLAPDTIRFKNGVYYTKIHKKL